MRGIGIGLFMIVGSIVWFVLGLLANRIFFYPPILLILGIIKFVTSVFALIRESNNTESVASPIIQRNQSVNPVATFPGESADRNSSPMAIPPVIFGPRGLTNADGTLLQQKEKKSHVPRIMIWTFVLIVVVAMSMTLYLLNSLGNRNIANKNNVPRQGRDMRDPPALRRGARPNGESRAESERKLQDAQRKARNAEQTTREEINKKQEAALNEAFRKQQEQAKAELLNAELAREKQEEEQKEREKARIDYANSKVITKRLTALNHAYRRQATNRANDTLITAMSEQKSSGLSWRVHLLPFLDNPDLHHAIYKSFHLDEPWDSTHNLELATKAIPEIFQDKDVPAAHTRIRSVLNLDGPTDALIRYKDLTDGLDQTAFSFHVPVEYSILWTKPDALEPLNADSTIDAIAATAAKERIHFFNMAWLADYPIQSPELFRAFATPNGREWIIRKHDKAHEVLFLEKTKSDFEKEMSVEEEERLAKEKLTKLVAALTQARADSVFRFRDLDKKRFLSWRVHILPYIGEQELYKKFDLNEPWDGKTNRKLVKDMPEIFRLQSREGFTRLRFPDGSAVDRFYDIPMRDDPALTAMLFYAAPHAAVPWTGPDYQDVTLSKPSENLGCSADRPTLAAAADGSIMAIDSSLHASKWISLLSRDGNENFDLAKALAEPDQPIQLIIPVEPPGALPKHVVLPQLTVSKTTLNAAPQPVNPTDKKLHEIVLGVMRYQDRYRGHPNNVKVDGRASGLSWRVHILPFIGEESLYSKFRIDEPWDSEENIKLISYLPQPLRLPGYANDKSPYVMLPASAKNAGQPKYRNTDLLVYVTDAKTAEPWTKPDDRLLPEVLEYSDLTQGTSLVFASASGKIYHLPTSYPKEILQVLTDPESGIICDLETVRRHVALAQGKQDYGGLTRDEWETHQLRTVLFSMFNYQSTHKEFPLTNAHLRVQQQDGARGNDLPAVTSYKLSWRVYLLPFLGHDKLYKQFRLNEPWDSPHNKQLIPLMPDCFRDGDDPVDQYKTRIMVFCGLNTPFVEPGNCIDPGGFLDGTHKTILLFQASPGLEAIWTKPVDFDIKWLSKLEFSRGLKIGLADGAVQQMPPGVSETRFRALISPAGGELLSSDEWLPE